MEDTDAFCSIPKQQSFGSNARMASTSPSGCSGNVSNTDYQLSERGCVRRSLSPDRVGGVQRGHGSPLSSADSLLQKSVMTTGCELCKGYAAATIRVSSKGSLTLVRERSGSSRVGKISHVQVLYFLKGAKRYGYGAGT